MQTYLCSWLDDQRDLVRLLRRVPVIADCALESVLEILTCFDEQTFGHGLVDDMNGEVCIIVTRFRIEEMLQDLLIRWSISIDIEGLVREVVDGLIDATKNSSLVLSEFVPSHLNALGF